MNVKVYEKATHGCPVVAKGQGVFAKLFTRRFPLIPVEEEGRLNDWRLKENFITRMFAYARFQMLLKYSPKQGTLEDFHQRHRLLFMAHSPEVLSQLDALCAKGQPFEETSERYLRLMLKALGSLARRTDHARIMRHIMDILKADLTPRDKDELQKAIEDYEKCFMPLIVPITLVKHHIHRCASTPDWLRKQVYLEPGPKELCLRVLGDSPALTEKEARDAQLAEVRRTTFLPPALTSGPACGECPGNSTCGSAQPDGIQSGDIEALGPQVGAWK